MRWTSTIAELITPRWKPQLEEVAQGQVRHRGRADRGTLRGAMRCAHQRPRGSRQRPPAEPPPAVELIGVDKHFGPVHANRSIDLRIPAGTIHGIVGENGAGKSTLMNGILYGFYQADRGSIRVAGDDRDREPRGRDRGRHRHGPSALHAGRAVHRCWRTCCSAPRAGPRYAGGRERRARRNAPSSSGNTPSRSISTPWCATCPVGLQQRVEILKALFRGAKVLILDEPTGVLTPQEADHLFRILRNLRDGHRGGAMLITASCARSWR